MLDCILRFLVFITLKMIASVCFFTSMVYYFKKPKKCPPIHDKIFLYSARTLAEMIRRKEISSEYVVKAYISRIIEVNPLVNAVVEERFDQALEEAKYIDQMLSNTQLSSTELATQYPLLGIPLTVKESLAVKGMSHCAGLVSREGHKASENADAVELCIKAGAVVLAVSNTPELTVSFETYNKITGRTCNPYDTRRTTGGSSGGEAALLGAAASIIGLGSDIHGSLRLPAHFCCVWGHKPTATSVSIKGHYPDCKQQSIWKQVLHVGPMTRYAEDLPILLKVILKEDFNFLMQLNKKVNIQDIKIFYMENNNNSLLTHSIDREITNRMRKFVKHMELMYDCKTEKLQLNGFKYSPELAATKMFSIDQVEDLYENNCKGCFGELFKYLTCRSTLVLMTILCKVTKKLSYLIPNSLLCKCDNHVFLLKNQLAEILGENGVLLYPSHPTVANYHGRMFGKIFDYSYLGIFNCFGFPATNCPLGLNSDGLPISMQVIANTNNDRLNLAIAREIESLFEGWIPPFSENVETTNS